MLPSEPTNAEILLELTLAHFSEKDNSASGNIKSGLIYWGPSN